MTVFESELKTDVNNNPIQFPSYRLPHDSWVEISPLPSNTQPVFVALGANQTGAGIRKAMAPTFQGAVVYAVEVTSEIFLKTTVVGEGVTYRVVEGAGGGFTQVVAGPTGDAHAVGGIVYGPPGRK